MGNEKLVFFPLLALALSLSLGFADAASSLQQPVKLRWHYYKVHNSCRNAEVYVRHQVGLYVPKDKSIIAGLLRLLYSDCFVTGCDGSILLDGPKSEKTAPQNNGLNAAALELIDDIKTVLESRCPGVVSCADILNLATRDAVHLAGAPSYPVFTGRKDGMKSSAASVNLPSPNISWKQAIAFFQSKGLDELDLATLLGAHSMGKTHCSNVVDRLYNFNGTRKADPSMDASFRNQMRKSCPKGSKGNNDPRVWLNPESGSNYRFTQSYYQRILKHKGCLQVDQQLLYGSNDTTQIIQEFANGFEDLRKAFALSMSRMGGINVLTGNQGEIRRHCRFTNKDNPYH